ncbi:Neutral alkaline non-lysosomal ceramidase [Diaporthe eres]|nr:Neutral alkaline non-lysosomal ceramidase [Diaporthe eres]
MCAAKGPAMDEWPAFNGLAQSSAAGCDFCRMLRDIFVFSPRHMKKFGNVSRRVRVILQTVHEPEGEFTESGDWLHTMYGLKVFMHDVQKPRHHMDQLDTAFVCTNLGLPTMLLDLAELLNGRVKLVISHDILDGLGSNIRYAALRYCWGDRETARYQSVTTVNNLKDRKSGFDVKYLSPVIQDAVQVCSSLSIRFLWVDALCILQGDSRDWGEESQRLWETFRGAYITICATSSTSCQERFLQDRPIHPGLNIKLDSAYGGQTSTRTSEKGSSVNCRIIPIPRNVLASDQGGQNDIYFMGDISDSRWLHRGWVHKEMAFSRRLVTFGTHLIFVRCSDVKACENRWRTSHSGIMLDEIDLVDLRKNPFSHFWRDVERFCGKEFTHRTDVLPAMAALARQVHRETKSQYLAGMWRENLANDLLFSGIQQLQSCPSRSAI